MIWTACDQHLQFVSFGLNGAWRHTYLPNQQHNNTLAIDGEDKDIDLISIFAVQLRQKTRHFGTFATSFWPKQ